MNSMIKQLRLTGLMLLAVVQAACIGGGEQPAIRYYLLDPVPVESALSESASGLKLELIDLQIPQYLEHFQIATRKGENELHFSEFHQWGENLRKNLMRTLVRNLSQLLDTDDISTPLNRTASMPELRLQVYIERFDQGSDGHVYLDARWQLSTLQAAQAGEMLRFSSRSETGVEQGDYTAMVKVMQGQYGALCEAIAQSINTAKRDGV